jgi:pimeloyl-ACP methyl ester carboxylesterase
MSRPTRALSFVILSVSALSGCGQSSGSGAPAAQRARFETTACPFKVSGGAFPRSHVHCGYLVVPESRQIANGKTIKVAVAIFTATMPHPATDPLVYLIGGPAGEIVASWGSSIVATGIPSYAGNRDFILVDQRGAGLSRPQLACPEIDKAGWQALDQRLSQQAANQRIYQALAACRARLIRAGNNLAAYTTVENAADFADLRTVLGYQEIDLQGGSYGSTLALQIMRDHPEGIRSVILEAIADPPFDMFNDFIPSTWNSLQRVFTECAASPICSARHPHLRQTFVSDVRGLQARPLAYHVFVPERGRSYPMTADGAAFINAVHSLLQNFQTIPLVPELIDEVKAGQGPLLSRSRQQASWSTDPGRVGMFLSVACSQDQSRASLATIAASSRVVPASVRSAFITAMFMMTTIDDLTAHVNPLTACTIWHVPSLAPVNFTDFHSNIPTLMLPGTFDPNTRPERMPALATQLGHAYLVAFPTYGHGAVTAGPCPDGIVVRFLAHPDQKPNTSCAARLRTVWQ